MRDDESGWFERNFIERRGPASWRAIGAYFALAVLALCALLIGPGTGRRAWEAFAGLVVLVAVMQVLRGIGHMVWLAMGGSERPLRTYLRKWLGR